MSALAALLSTLKDAHAERVFFAPGEVGKAFDQGVSRELPGGPLAPTTLVTAVSELLSQDEMRGLPSNRPRILRHEHDGDDYVIEVVRLPGGVAVGIRHARTTLRRTPSDGRNRDSLRDSVRGLTAPPELVAPAPKPPHVEEAPPPRRASKRLRAQGRDRATIRVEVDEEGNPTDATAIELDVRMPGDPPKPPTRRTSKGFKGPVITVGPAGERIYETRIIPRAGQPATNHEIAGSPAGAYVTFLYAPNGFSLVTEKGTIVIEESDDSAIRGELFVGPSMKLRITAGPSESLVTFYRR